MKLTSVVIGFFYLFTVVNTAGEENYKPVSLTKVKTSFSCAGRPSGYYADMETGCRVYHMCDGMGRQFTNRCPNATLFQQRMLICDHWYMVKCELSEKNYAANLLIGQKDELFVRDDENVHEIRTPRPDLGDRPYAYDYSGESFRKLFNNDFTGSNFIIPAIEQPKGFSPRSSATRDDIFVESESSYRPPPVANQQQNIAKEIKKSVQSSPAASASLTSSTFSVAPSTSFSTFTNALPSFTPSTFSFTTRPVSTFSSAAVTTTTPLPPTTAEIKPPSKYYTPPFLEPAYNLEKDDNFLDTPKITERRQLESSLGLPNQQKKAEFQAFDSILKAVRKANREDYDFSKYVRNKQGQQQQVAASRPVSTTTRPTVRSTVNRVNLVSATAQAPTGFRLPQTAQTTRAPPTTTRSTTRFTTRSTTRATTRRAPATTRAPITSSTSHRPSVSQVAPRIGTASKVASVPIPSNQLQPPFEEFSKLDSVTLGPPIYYEWKANIPSIDLLPPLEDNEQLDGNSSGDVIGAHSQTTRSISEQSFENSFEKAVKKLLGTNYSLLKKELSIPEYQFPLEGEGARTGYDNKEAINSFQIKIPDKATLQYSEWYGENPQCPECHPSFVKPGTCEPCVKIRE